MSADRMLREVYDVSSQRRALCLDAAESTMAALSRQREGDISLYVGIPFCPTRCIYCSFVSAATEKSRKLIPVYLKALEQEICAAAEGLKRHPHRIRTVYIGGGTPTTLSAEELRWLLDTLHQAFDLSECLEFTVEAGRPDTLDPEKLFAIRQGGATRISINPQTMDDRVLEIMGRSHTSADILRAYGQAVEAGHSDINMDLIAGLPGDHPRGIPAYHGTGASAASFQYYCSYAGTEKGGDAVLRKAHGAAHGGDGGGNALLCIPFPAGCGVSSLLSLPAEIYDRQL